MAAASVPSGGWRQMVPQYCHQPHAGAPGEQGSGKGPVLPLTAIHVFGPEWV